MRGAVSQAPAPAASPHPSSARLGFALTELHYPPHQGEGEQEPTASVPASVSLPLMGRVPKLVRRKPVLAQVGWGESPGSGAEQMTTPVSSNPLRSHHKTPATPNLCTDPKTHGRFTSSPPRGDGATNDWRWGCGGFGSRPGTGRGKRITGPSGGPQAYLSGSRPRASISPTSGEAKVSPNTRTTRTRQSPRPGRHTRRPPASSLMVSSSTTIPSATARRALPHIHGVPNAPDRSRSAPPAKPDIRRRRRPSRFTLEAFYCLTREVGPLEPYDPLPPELFAEVNRLLLRGGRRLAHAPAWQRACPFPANMVGAVTRPRRGDRFAETSLPSRP